MNPINKYFYEYNCLYHSKLREALQKIDIRTLVYRDQTSKILAFIDRFFQNISVKEKEDFFNNWNNAVVLLYKISDGRCDEYNEVAIERVREMISNAISINLKNSSAPQNLLKISKEILSKNLFLYLLEKHDGNIPIGQLSFYNEEAQRCAIKYNINFEEIYKSL